MGSGTVKQLREKVDQLHHALVDAERKTFAMWTVLNTVMHLMRDKNVYTMDEYVEMGKKLAEERERLIKERIAQSKAGEPVRDVPQDLLQQKIDAIAPSTP
jgi:translation initiation factor 2B subunit (eIF-2B alpha/beta/delta family)